jgi:hypothetical protein
MIKSISECGCDERLNTKAEESTRLTYTGLIQCTRSDSRTFEVTFSTTEIM